MSIIQSADSVVALREVLCGIMQLCTGLGDIVN